MKKLLRTILIKIPLLLVALGLFFVLLYSFAPVMVTPLIITRSVSSEAKVQKQWIPIEKMSPNIIKAVIAGEDNLFPVHDGFDFDEIRKMKKEHETKGRKIRGCSTISQQTAKNVFTFGTHTYIRKGVEAWYTFLIEKIWGKERIMEVYLNVAEWGDGIYGIQAASLHYFGCDAEKLGKRQAALLAAALPSPIKRNPARPGRYMNRRADQICSLMGKISYPDWVSHKKEKK